MCGIFGELAFCLTEEARRNAVRASSQLSHRGPDGEGLWSDAHCVLAHRRLKIIDLSNAAGQPMGSASGRSVITFNGEIYNYLELRSRQGPPNGGWRTSSDTEVLVEHLEQNPDAALGAITGMFAFAWWRPAERVLWLARDRLGEKPLFYALLPGGRLRFSSELPPLLDSPDQPRRTTHARVAEYLQYGYVSAPRTSFEGIECLPPAHVLKATLRDDRIAIQVTPYWSLRRPPSPRRSGHEWLEEFEYTLRDSAKITLRSDVPVSALLSGGVDSSVVCLLAARETPKLITVTADQGGSASEVEYAREVAGHIGVRNLVVPLRPPGPEGLDEFVRIYPELMGDASALAALAVCRAIRTESTVALTGDGGDELGGGYSRYGIALDASRDPLPRIMRRVMALAARRFPVWIRGEQRLARRAPLGDLPYRALVHMYPAHEIPPVLRRSQRPADPLVDSMHAFADAPPLVRMMLTDSETYIPSDTLVTLDRASMSVGLELRAPLLDYRLFDLLRDARDDYFVRDGATKLPFRRIFADLLPRSVFSRKKAGFSVPLDEWVRAMPLEELLLSRHSVLGPLVSLRRVAALLDGFRAGLNRHAGRLWHLAVLARWMEFWRPSVG